MAKLERDGVEPILFDVLVGEAISGLCRRFRERRKGGDLGATVAEFCRRFESAAITWVAVERVSEKHQKSGLDTRNQAVCKAAWSIFTLSLGG